jgi:CBS domain-containing protein
MRARDVLTPATTTFRLDTPIQEAAALLAEKRISAAPVVDDAGSMVGVVTDAELLSDWFAADSAPRTADSASRTVGEVMTRAVIAVPPLADVADVAAAMVAYGVTSVRIVENATVVGMICRRDLIRAIVTEAELDGRGELDPVVECHALRQLAHTPGSTRPAAVTN